MIFICSNNFCLGPKRQWVAKLKQRSAILYMEVRSHQKWGAKNYDNERDVDADYHQCVHGYLLPNIRCRTLVEPPSVNLDTNVFRLAQSDNGRQASIRYVRVAAQEVKDRSETSFNKLCHDKVEPILSLTSLCLVVELPSDASQS